MRSNWLSPISAAKQQGFDKLMWAVSDALSRNFVDLDIETGVENGRLMAYLAAHGEIMSRRFNDTRVVIHCRLPQKHLGRVQEPGTDVRPHARDRMAEPFVNGGEDVLDTLSNGPADPAASSSSPS